MAERLRTYSPVTIESIRLWGAQIRLERRRRRWTASELGERVGVDRTTVGRIERGDLSVGVGLTLEAAVMVGIPLFSAERDRRVAEWRRVSDLLALLPQRTRALPPVDDDF